MSSEVQNVQARDELMAATAEALQKHEYTIVKELGHGISGRAFLVKNPDEDFLVVKRINYRDNPHIDMETVREEIKILKNLHHGYIIKYEDSFEESGYLYIVSEYCSEEDLQKKMQKQEGFFEEEQILDWFVQICLALQYLHQKNILHRDIKPQNVFLTEDGYINVGDFGCSKLLQSADQYATSIVGAEFYVSPEVFERRHNSKSDIWSLGWVLYDLCMLDVWSNILERRCVHANCLTGTTPKISDRYSDDLRALIIEMLSSDPHDRPSAEDILAKPFLSKAVNRNTRLPDVLEQKFLKSAMAFNEAYRRNYKDFQTVVSEWGETTDELEEMFYKTTVASLSGATIGAAGGITALVGAFLSLVTFGASLIVAGVGIGVGVAGGVTGAASNITKTAKQNSLQQKLIQIQQRYENTSAPILTSLRKVRKFMKKLDKFSGFLSNSTIDNVQMAWRVGRAGIAGVTEFVTLGMLAGFGRLAVQAAGVGRIVAAASGVLSGFLVIADVIFIVKDSKVIHQMRQHWKTDDPEKVTSPTLKSFAQMRKTHKELCNVLVDIRKTRQELQEALPFLTET